MVSPHDTLRALLKDNGFSLTNPRLKVFDALVGQEPLTMRQLTVKVSSIDRASVYRTVELFEKLGIVHRIVTGWKYKIELSDRFMEHHHHLTCIRCGKTVAMNEAKLEQFIEQIAFEHGFKPTEHQIELQGICKTCQS